MKFSIDMDKTIIKILFSILCLCLSVAGCETYVDEFWRANKEFEEAVEAQEALIAALESRCRELNSNVEALAAIVNAMPDYDNITSIVPVVKDGLRIGYTISFMKGPDITIYDGEGGPGHVPVIGVAKDPEDGFYYWTLEGEWIVVDGHRIKCDGEEKEIPLISTKDGRWIISYDNGQTWTDLGKADGIDGDPMFSSVTIYSTYVEFVLSDGTIFSVPKYSGTSISFSVEGSETGVVAGQSITIRYHVENATENTVVTAMSDGNYKVSIHPDSFAEGDIVITSPKYYQDGHVTILVSDGLGISFTKRLFFYERKIEFSTGKDIYIPSDGMDLYIPFRLNFDYHVEVDKGSWVKLEPYTKAEMRDEVIKAKVEPNYEFTRRQAVLKIWADNNPDAPEAEIRIIQDPAFFWIERGGMAMNHESSSFEIYFASTMATEAVSDAEWLKVSISDIWGDEYNLKGTVDYNSGSRRKARIVLRNESDKRELAVINVTQLAEGAENPDAMILRMRAERYNGFKVKLPFSGHVDCYVDWGDGTGTEHFTDFPVSHKYADKTPKDYIVKITGTVSGLNSRSGDPIIEVIQWGRTDLNDMWSAFENNRYIETLPENINDSFAKVGSFDNVFRNCTALKSIPENLFGKTENHNFNNTFHGCTALESVPENLFRYCTEARYFSETFSNCTSLKSIPEDLFRYNTKITNMQWIFHNTAVKEIPDYLLESCTELVDVGYMFYNSPLESVPAGLFSSCGKITNMNGTFRGTNIETIPNGFLDACTDLRSVSEMFADCLDLRRIPVSLFDKNRMVESFSYTFNGNINLRGESPYAVINGKKVHLYDRVNYPDHFIPVVNSYRCFGECVSMNDYRLIPDEWKN